METTNNLKYQRARKQVKRIKGFWIHAIVFICVNMFFIFENLFQLGSFNFYSSFFSTFFWGIGLAFHGLSVFGKQWIFGEKWEQQQIEKMMNR